VILISNLSNLIIEVATGVTTIFDGACANKITGKLIIANTNITLKKCFKINSPF
jgi:hypothetical protein